MARLGAISAIVITCLAGACAPGHHTADHREAHSFPAAEASLVRVDVHGHDVHLTAAPGDTVAITTEQETRAGSPQAAQRLLESSTPLVELGPAGVYVRMPAHSDRIRRTGFSRTTGQVTITAPPDSTFDITTSSGDVTVTGEEDLTTPLRIRTASGNLSLKTGVRELIFRSAAGDARIDGRPLGVFEGKTSSGNIRLDSGAERVLVDTASGSVRLLALTGPVSVRTASGNARMTWTALPGGTRVAVRTVSGNVDMTLPIGPVQGIASTRSGRVQSDLPGDHDSRRRTVTFSSDGPATELEVSSASGNIRLRITD